MKRFLVRTGDVRWESEPQFTQMLEDWLNAQAIDGYRLTRFDVQPSRALASGETYYWVLAVWERDTP